MARALIQILVLLFLLAVNLVVGVSVGVPSSLDYKVTGLDQWGNSDDLYAGFMPLMVGPAEDGKQVNSEGALFFLLAKSRSPTSKLVVWLNGGPA